MYPLVKRAMDIVLSAVGVLILAPVLIVVWLAVGLTSAGPAIFRQERAGKAAAPFRMLKFRTMRTDVDPFGPSPKSGQDPRLTKVGKFLRETSLDELPQLFNVLGGSMSLVGPRPLYISQIAEWNDCEKKRLLVKPGLTGLAQVYGRGHLTREEKLELDVRYVEEAGVWLDMKLILLTVVNVFGKHSIYEKQYSKTQATRGKTQ